MKEILQDILHALVDHPASIDLTELSGNSATIFELRCHEEDIGKVIGKNGKTVHAIRSLLNAIAARDEQLVVFEVIE